MLATLVMFMVMFMFLPGENMNVLKVKPAAHPGQTKTGQLAGLRQAVSFCERCPGIVEARTQTVFGEGNPDSSLLIVGEAPGYHEDLQGKPFVGAAGDFLTTLIRGLGVERRDVYIANALKCRPHVLPGQGNRKPTRPEMLDCLPYLLAQIEIIDPIVILALGSTALEALGIEKSVTEAQGQWYVACESIPVMATFHPAYVLRNPTQEIRNQTWRAFREAWLACHGEPEEKADWVPTLS
jgi:DNA polymerase